MYLYQLKLTQESDSFLQEFLSESYQNIDINSDISPAEKVLIQGVSNCSGSQIARNETVILKKKFFGDWDEFIIYSSSPLSQSVIDSIIGE